MISVLICTNSFPPHLGGIATYGFQIASNLSRNPGLRLKVIAPYVPRHEAIDSKLSFPVFRYRKKIFLYPKLLYHALRTDIIFIVQRGNYATFAYWLNFIRKTPYVVAAHGIEPNSKKRIKITRNLNAAARITPVSHFTASFLESIGVNKNLIKVINNGATAFNDNGINIKSKYNVKNKMLLLTIGRLVVRKGHDNVIAALPSIKNKIPNVHYLIVGDGPNRKSLEKQVKIAGLANDVTFAGYAPYEELGAFYHACDLFIMLSRELPGNVEGFGIVYLEAGAAGKAVVAGRSGGTSDAVIDGETGILVAPENTVEITTVVSDLLRDPQKRKLLGNNAKRRVLQEYSWKSVAKKYGDLFQKIVEENKNNAKLQKMRV
jgi:phosphatidylinositol alpha-1,6-mannosyltransferase